MRASFSHSNIHYLLQWFFKWHRQCDFSTYTFHLCFMNLTFYYFTYFVSPPFCVALHIPWMFKGVCRKKVLHFNLLNDSTCKSYCTMEIYNEHCFHFLNCSSYFIWESLTLKKLTQILCFHYIFRYLFSFVLFLHHLWFLRPLDWSRRVKISRPHWWSEKPVQPQQHNSSNSSSNNPHLLRHNPPSLQNWPKLTQPHQLLSHKVLNQHLWFYSMGGSPAEIALWREQLSWISCKVKDLLHNVFWRKN